jgi:hypothetical protein
MESAVRLDCPVSALIARGKRTIVAPERAQTNPDEFNDA